MDDDFVDLYKELNLQNMAHQNLVLGRLP
jgi:hypothetical protein